MKEKWTEKIREYLIPRMDAELTTALDRQSLRNICNVSLAVFFFEILSILVFMTTAGWRFEGSTLVSFYSVGFCAAISLICFLVSRRMMKNRNLPHWCYFVFKIFFYTVYTVWAIQVDMRHYKAEDQMMTFFTVQLMIVCFVMFRPWMSILLTTAAYAGLYAAAVYARGADGIDIFNYVILAVLSIVGMCIRFYTQIYLGRKEGRLKSDAKILEQYMRQDGLTGLQNRLALEEDAKNVDGRPMTAYMIDVNSFKMINDRYGHITGDAILKETGAILQRLFPKARYYRYGGDEFLVLSGREKGQNYGESVYAFQTNTAQGTCDVSLSIGSAGGTPETYDGLFEMISRADKALYEIKARMHSPRYGGQDRRRRDDSGSGTEKNGTEK